MRLLHALAAGLFLTALAAPAALADDTDTGAAGHFQIRLRGVAVLPDASATVYVAGHQLAGSTSVTNSLIPEVDGTYFFTDNLAVEVIAGTTQHSVHQATAGDIGSVWLLPPTANLQYHLDPDASVIRPYVGAGLNYTFFYSPRSPLPDIKYEDNFGWDLQAGADFPLGNSPYFLNIDAKKLFLDTTVSAAGGIVHAHADLNPWLVGAGVGYRF